MELGGGGQFEAGGGGENTGCDGGDGGGGESGWHGLSQDEHIVQAGPPPSSLITAVDSVIGDGDSTDERHRTIRRGIEL